MNNGEISTQDMELGIQSLSIGTNGQGQYRNRKR